MRARASANGIRQSAAMPRVALAAAPPRVPCCAATIKAAGKTLFP
ncbi:hypothetical protein GLE_3667 [Lysobacter enzymogenes]|uniref:Uncharacterized protein n=1 Tax=Lysobacter enzymogenes TaxID=69 RepID=A0A0S2DKI1_LYSEN|nr:hypothetical protein GLE_3667 [Lysobacter enzymogenes]